MPDNWEAYRDWKELMENIRRRPREDNDYYDDDNVEDLTELLRDYSE